MPLHLGHLCAFEGVVDGLPEPRVPDMRVDALLLEVVVDLALNEVLVLDPALLEVRGD